MLVIIPLETNEQLLTLSNIAEENLFFIDGTI
jgi:hypothetical protein